VPRRWEVFCRVVDHFGDIGVSWRLARALARDHGLDVRLWVDDLHTFHGLWPDVDPARAVQRVENVDVHRWTDAGPWTDPGDVVIEAFGSRTPDACVDAMAARPTAPVWINLEYLTAESWIDDCHGLASPHPTQPLVKHFFFPGFVPESGGLIEERGLAQARQAFVAQPAAARWAAIGLAAPAEASPQRRATTTISFFGYGGAAVASLLRAWADGAEATHVVVPASRILGPVAAFFGAGDARAGDRFHAGALTVDVIGFLRQDRYDALLWACDCNFVRGEDSFVRAQWAERPFVWQIYPQDAGAHWTKLHAFVDRYGAGLEDDTQAALRELWRLWNRAEADPAVIGAAWRRWWAQREELDAHAAAWAARQRTHGDLASNLVRFTAACLYSRPLESTPLQGQARTR
jgi:uncharacterized repeat protein (TIGR03837 family)